MSAVSQPVHSVRPPRRSNKPPAIKSSVIIQRAQGKAKSHIARDLGITHNTVNAILEESDIERQLTCGVQLTAGLIPQAIGVIKKRLDLGSENAAIKVLEATIWPLDKGQSGAQMLSAGLSVTINNLLGTVQPVKQIEAIDVKPETK